MNNNNHKVQNSDDERRKLIRGGTLQWFHWFIVAFSVVLTLTIWYLADQNLGQRAKIQFEREADQVIGLVKERLELYENALWGGVALYDASDDVTHAEWNRYANSISLDTRYPGINGLGVIYSVQAPELDAYLENERQVRPDFKIHPQRDETEYWPITYIEPNNTNQKAVGLDIGFEQNRYDGVKEARDSGQARLTGPIVLVQDDKQTPGFLFYAPFYKDGLKPDSAAQRRDSILGVSYAPFIVNNLMDGTLAKSNRHVHITIRDGDALLYDDEANGSNLEDDPEPLFVKQVSVNLYGRTWTFNISSNLYFRHIAERNDPYYILAGGIILDSLLLALFFFLSASNRRALRYADDVTEELKLRSQDLEASNSELEQFAYVASHDLKAPLRSISNLSSWIVEDASDKLPEESRKHLGQLRTRVNRMESLIEDLLVYSRIGKTDLEYELVDCNQLVNGIIELLDPPAGFSIEFRNDLPTLSCKMAPLKQVFINLIGNAIKHSENPSAGKLQISSSDKGAEYEFVLQDNGPGIPDSLHEKAFKMYQTLKPRDTVEGSGMGLAIINKLVKAEGGELTLDSDEGHGCTFRFTWPKAQADGIDTTRQAANDSTAKRVALRVVDG